MFTRVTKNKITSYILFQKYRGWWKILNILKLVDAFRDLAIRLVDLLNRINNINITNLYNK